MKLYKKLEVSFYIQNGSLIRKLFTKKYLECFCLDNTLYILNALDGQNH